MKHCSFFVLFPIYLSIVHSFYTVRDEGISGPVRICDETQSVATLKLTEHPDCPGPTQYDKDMRHIGTLMVFKMKPQFNVTMVKGFACWWFVYYRKTSWSPIGPKSLVDSWERPVPASEEQCRFWVSQKKCNFIEPNSVYMDPSSNISSSMLVNMSQLAELPRGGFLYTTQGVYPFDEYIYGRTSDTYSYRCYMADTIISAIAPTYDTLVTDHRGRVPYFTNSKGLAIFEQAGTFVDYSENVRYVWNVSRTNHVNRCLYQLHEIHLNVSLVELVPQNPSPFYFVLHRADRYMFIDPINQKLKGEKVDSAYCLSQRVKTHPAISYYKSTTGDILAYFHNANLTLVEVNDHVTDTEAHNNISHDTQASVYIPMPDNIKIPNDKMTIVWQSDKVIKMIFTSRSPEDLKSTNFTQQLLPGDITMRKIHYFPYQLSKVDWKSSLERIMFQSWCKQNKINYGLTKAMAAIDPSAALSVYFGRNIYARREGDVYKILRCHVLMKNEFMVATSLVADSTHQLCYSRPIIKLLQGYNGEGQILDDGRIVIPPAMTETCRLPSTLHFYINGFLHTFRNYTLVNEKDAQVTKPELSLIQFEGKWMHNGELSLDYQINNNRLKSNRSIAIGNMQLGFSDIIELANRRRVSDNRLARYAALIEQAAGLPNPAITWSRCLNDNGLCFVHNGPVVGSSRKKRTITTYEITMKKDYKDHNIVIQFINRATHWVVFDFFGASYFGKVVTFIIILCSILGGILAFVIAIVLSFKWMFGSRICKRVFIARQNCSGVHVADSEEEDEHTLFISPNTSQPLSFKKPSGYSGWRSKIWNRGEDLIF